MGLYCSVEDIRKWLGTTKYDDEFLERLIREKMEYIDRLTATAWAGEEKRAEIYADVTKFRYGWIFGVGMPLYLPHMYIKRIESLKVFNGSEWVELAKPENEGRGKTYWVDEVNGVVFLRAWVLPWGGKEIRIVYTYGRDDLPDNIRELCRLLVVRDLLITERKQFAVPDGMEGLQIREMLSWIEKRIMVLEEQVRAIIPAIGVIY